MKKRLIALLLASLLLAGLFTGCGEGEEAETELPGQVQSGKQEEESSVTPAKFAYKASYTPLTTHEGEAIDYANYFCASGGYAYYVGSYMAGMAEVTDPVTGEVQIDPETGEAYTYEEYKDGLFRLDLDTLSVSLMEGYRPREIPEGYEGNSYINNLAAGADGTVWVQEETYTYYYDLPEDFDDETDDYWNYYVEGERYNTLSLYSAEGEKLSTIDLNFGQDVYIGQLMIDDRGYLYASDYNQVYLLDSTGALVETLSSEDGWMELAQLSASQVGALSYNAEGQAVVKLIDPEAKAFGEELPVVGGGSNIQPGFGEYQYVYSSSDNVYGVAEGAETGEKLFSWLDCDIDLNNINGFFILEDGRVAALERDWSSGSGESSLVLLEQVDPSTIPQKQELVLGCMYLDYDLRPLIVEFNRSHDDVRIVVKDYSEYIQNDDYDAAIQKLNTEILSGTGPDILTVDNIPLEQYAAKGVFVDLWPLIDADAELSRDDLMTHLFDCLSIDGKLYQVMQSFSIRTAAVDSDIAQGRTSWSLEELLEALDTLEPDAAIFGEGDTKTGMLTQVLSFNLDSYIDWAAGTCSFDSDEFIEILEFANSFPAEFDYENYDWETAESEYSRLQSRRQLMSATYLSSFDELQVAAGLHGGDVTFIGYPSESGNGSCFMAYGGLAISSACQDVNAAWEFVRELLLEENQTEDHMWNFPTNKYAFETYVEQAMTPEYEIDPETGLPAIDPETGEKIEMSTGGIGYGDDFMVDLYSMKQEEYDAFMALYEACANVYSYNDEIMQIILEEAAAFFEGQKTAQETASLIQNRLSLYVSEQM